MEKKISVSMASPSQMVKTTVRIHPITGEISEEEVLKPGENKYKALQEQRAKKLGI